MPFQPGHPPMGGRPKSMKTQIKEWEDANPHAYNSVMAKLYELGMESNDKDCLIYVANRLKGTPKQTIDQRTLNIDFTPDDYLRLLPALEARTKTLIAIAGNIAGDVAPTVAGDVAKGACIVDLPESESH